MNGERYATVLRNPDSVARSETTEVAHTCSLHYPHQTNGLGSNVYYGSIYSDKHVTRPTSVYNTMENNSANEDRQYNSDVENNGVNDRHQNSSQNYKLKEIKKTRQSKVKKEGLKDFIIY